MKTQIMLIDKIFDHIRLQCPVYAVNFAADFQSGFPSIAVVPEFDGETETIFLIITSETFCLNTMALKEGGECFVSGVYAKLKRLVEQTVGDTLLERNVSTVIGKDKSCLYGEWSVEKLCDVIQFTCKVNLTVASHENQT